MNKLDVLNLISPQMKEILAMEDQLGGDANDTSCGFEQMRENYVAGRRYWVQGGPEMAETLDRELAGPHGSFKVRFYYPTEEAKAAYESHAGLLPAIVYVHGGGFVLGNLDTHDRICRVLAHDADAIVMAVDYHLSPEAKYPSAVEEVAFAREHLHNHGDYYGVDGDRLAMAGDSGGAHLNLASTLYLREENGDASFVKCLLLYYGWFGLQDSASMRLLGGPWDGLTEEDWQYYLKLYAEDPAKLASERYANLFLNDLSRDMPACYIAAAEFDPLKDDSRCLAEICKQYGVPCEYEVFKGTIHAFLHYTRKLDAAKDALEHGATFFRQTLGVPTHEE